MNEKHLFQRFAFCAIASEVLQCQAMKDMFQQMLFCDSPSEQHIRWSCAALLIAGSRLDRNEVTAVFWENVCELFLRRFNRF